MGRGRPLWFLGSVVVSWMGVRMAMLWPAEMPPPTRAAPVEAKARSVGMGAGANPIVSMFMPPQHTREPGRGPARQAARVSGSGTRAFGSRPSLPVVTVRGRDLAVEYSVQPKQTIVTPAAALLFAPRPVATMSRLAGDAWLVLRPGGGDNLAFGQLGASQGGARLTYALDDERRLALSARVSTPTRGRGAELAFGLDLRPTRLPVHLLVEERFGLDGGGARPAAGVIAGFSAALPERSRLDAYGQGGAVWRRGGFVDGAAIVTRPVLERGRTRIELGGGAWGAAQRRVARLDLGPSLAVVAPVAEQAVRLQIDYGIM